MILRLVYFAGAKDSFGRPDEIVDAPAEVQTLAGLRAHLAARGAAWRALADDKEWRFAVNRHLAGSDEAPILDGDEVAVFSAVTGG